MSLFGMGFWPSLDVDCVAGEYTLHNTALDFPLFLYNNTDEEVVVELSIDGKPAGKFKLDKHDSANLAGCQKEGPVFSCKPLSGQLKGGVYFTDPTQAKTVVGKFTKGKDAPVTLTFKVKFQPII